MSEPIAIQITNLAEIRSAFRSAPRLMSVELDKAIKKTVFSIQAKSMINTPVNTGRLRASTSSSFSPLKGQVGTHTSYDIFVHNGTRYMKARPYLQEAVDQTASTVDGYFKKAVDTVLNKIGRMT
jgi:HK97 gp10 family phage protein